MRPPDAFARTEMLLGEKQAAALRELRVTIVGLGAVGAYVAEFLARSGVERFLLVDFDRAVASNLNRHPAVLHSTLGRPKVELVAARLRDIHPRAEVEAWPLFFHEETLGQVLAHPADVLVDAIDSYTPKLLLLRQAWKGPYFLVSAMGAGGRLDPGRGRGADLGDTAGCHLARRMRLGLRRHGIETGIRVVFSDEPARPTAAPEPDGYRRGRLRRVNGSIAYMPAVFAAWITREILDFSATRR